MNGSVQGHADHQDVGYPSDPLRLKDTIPATDFLGVPLTRCTVEEYIVWSVARIEQKRPTFVTYLNAWCSNIAADDDDYRQILHEVDCVYADGMGVVWGARLLGLDIPERVNAADFIPEFLRMCSAKGFRIGLIGSAEGVSEKAARRFLELAPDLEIVTTLTGFIRDNDATLSAIRDANPDVLLIGMGVPLQEKWYQDNRQDLEVPFAWCVGAMLEFYAGYTRRAPAWMCRWGLEWLFRLLVEPRRMARRYLIGNVRFIGRVLRAKATSRAT